MALDSFNLGLNISSSSTNVKSYWPNPSPFKSSISKGSGNVKKLPREWKRYSLSTESLNLSVKKNPEKSSPRFNNDKMVLARNVGIKLLLLILDSGDTRSKTETVTQQMVAKHQQEMTTKIINHADKRHSLRSSTYIVK